MSIENPKDGQIPQPVNHSVIYRVDKGHLDSVHYLEKEEGGVVTLAGPLTKKDQATIRKHRKLHQDLVVGDDHTPEGKSLTSGQRRNLIEIEQLMEKLRNGQL